MGSERRSGQWTIDPDLGTVTPDGGEPRRIGPTLMAALLALTGRPQRLITKDELIEEAWEGRAVSDDAVTVAIYELRKLFGDQARSPRFIETIPARGYRWLPPVEPVGRSAERPVPAPGADPRAVAAPPRATVPSREAAPTGGGSVRPSGAAAAVLVLVLATIAIGFLAVRTGGPAAGERARSGGLAAVPPSLSSAALDAYLEGRSHLSSGSRDRLAPAVESFRRAIDLAPDHAEAWAGLSEAYSTRVEQRLGEPVDELDRARSTAVRALELNPGSPEGHHALGLAAMLADWDLPEGEARFRRAVALDPSYGRGWRSLSWVLLARERWDEAEAAAQRAALLEPRSPEPLLPYATLLLGSGRAPEALATIERARSLADDVRGVLGIELAVLMELGRRDEATAVYREIFRAHGAPLEPFDRRVAEGGLDAVFGDVVGMESPSITHFWRAVLSGWLGDRQRSIRELELSADAGECEMLVAGVYPAFRTLDDDPRYAAVLARVGLGGVRKRALSAASEVPEPASRHGSGTSGTLNR